MKIVRMWAAAIKPYPGAKEPCKGMDYTNVTAGRLLVGKMSPTALCQAIIVLGGTSFCPLKILMVWAQVQEDVPPLNKIGEMPLTTLGDRKPS